MIIFHLLPKTVLSLVQCAMPNCNGDEAEPYKFDAKLVIFLYNKGRYTIEQLKRRMATLVESDLRVLIWLLAWTFSMCECVCSFPQE